MLTMTKKGAGFTIIELIMIIVIIAIIGLTTSGIIMFFMRNTIFLPNQMNVQQIADAAMDIMIEGDDKAGLRFASRITDIGDNKVRFINTDTQDVKFEILNNVVKRSIDGGPDEPIPYYATGDITITGENNKLFYFYKQNPDGTEGPAAVPSEVRRVEIRMIAKSGTGSINDWEGKAAIGSSVKLYKFNKPPVFTAGPAADPETIPETDQSTISFAVNDPDEGQVSWGATLKGSSGGTLSKTSGIANVPYSASITYTPKKFGSAKVTITLNDGNDGTAEDSANITVTK